MVMKPKIDRTLAFNIITQALKANPGGFQGTPPTELKWQDIDTMVALFQRRDISKRYGEDEGHVQNLQNWIGNNPDRPNMLDPIVVWWGGDCWYACDGHHRREAYRRQKVKVPVPVEVFEGTLQEAIAFATAANSKNRMTMTSEDKSNSAWLLTVMPPTKGKSEYTRAEIREIAGVSIRTVASMRRIKATLLTMLNPETRKDYTAQDLMGLTWNKAKLVAAGAELGPEPDWESALEERIRKYAARIQRQFVGKPSTDAEAFASALVELDRTIPGKYVATDRWQEQLDDAYAFEVRHTIESLLDELTASGEHVAAAMELRNIMDRRDEETALEFRDAGGDHQDY